MRTCTSGLLALLSSLALAACCDDDPVEVVDSLVFEHDGLSGYSFALPPADDDGRSAIDIQVVNDGTETATITGIEIDPALEGALTVVIQPGESPLALAAGDTAEVHVVYANGSVEQRAAFPTYVEILGFYADGNGIQNGFQLEFPFPPGDR